MQIATNKLGNISHAVSLTSVLAYTITTFLYAKPGSTFFDDDWVQHGFCIIQKDVPYWNSHDLCLYFDVILVAAGLLVYHALHGSVPNCSQMEYADKMIFTNLLGHLGHGFIHGYIGAKYRSGETLGVEYITGMERMIGLFDDDNSVEICKRVLISLGFWFGLLLGVMPKVPKARVAILAIVVYISGEMFVTDVLGFAYVQAVIGVAFASTQLALSRDEKDYVYAAFALVSIPISIIPWIESTACQRVASKLGGHLMYDVSIPIFLTVAYYASWCHYSSKVQGSSKDKEA